MPINQHTFNQKGNAGRSTKHIPSTKKGKAWQTNQTHDLDQAGKSCQLINGKAWQINQKHDLKHTGKSCQLINGKEWQINQKHDLDQTGKSCQLINTPSTKKGRDADQLSTYFRPKREGMANKSNT